MPLQSPSRLTKSDFLLFCDAPRHLWAKKHGRYQTVLSDFDQHLMKEGYRVEELAHKYLSTVILDQYPGSQLLWQQPHADGPFEIRLDGLVFKPASDTVDLYEIKSATGVKKENLYDLTFQALILEKQFTVDHYYVLHLNKEYIFTGELDLSGLFIAEDVTEKVIALKPEVEILRSHAIRIAQSSDPDESEACLSPRDCPCPNLCHPDLPEFSIFDIPRLGRDKKQDLLDAGIRASKDIPLSYPLNDKQRLVAERARTGREHIDHAAIAAELQKLQFPLYFLDYETCISAIPPYKGYHPQQQIVFQYSLHVLDDPGAQPRHSEHISPGEADPALPLLEKLRRDIGPSGSVIVWNKTFEMTRNKEMALLHPQHAAFLEDLNERIYDLGDPINYGYYLHPGFKGSWSIKVVLPVMVPKLSYENLPVNKGDQASVTWWKMTFERMDAREKEKLTDDLLRYCEMDSLAMLEIYKKLLDLSLK